MTKLFDAVLKHGYLVCGAGALGAAVGVTWLYYNKRSQWNAEADHSDGTHRVPLSIEEEDELRCSSQLDDIEESRLRALDLNSQNEAHNDDTYLNNDNGHGTVRVRRRKAKADVTPSLLPATGENKALIPGTQNIFFKTYGCSHNTSDAEFMMGQLEEYGYKLVASMADADLCIFNSCTVKNPSQDSFVWQVNEARKLKKHVVMSGCVPQGDRTLLKDVSAIGIQQINRVVDVVEQTLQGNVVRLFGRDVLPSLDLPKIRRNPLIEIIPLSTGCLGSCTYCKTKQARGVLGSYQLSAITDRVDRALSEGVKQIWLTSEDTGAYGLDIGSDVVQLLEAVVARLPADVMLRLGMTNPPYIKKHIDRIAAIMKHPNVFEFIHIPVQSGSNDTLKHMYREYTVEEFNDLVEGLRSRVGPQMTVATDIICGFPTEKDEHHRETLALLERHRFAVVNISQFYPRPKTPAAAWPRVPTEIVKRRSTEVTRLFESYETFQFVKDTEKMVWFTEHAERSRHTVGHTKEHVKILVEKDDALLGTRRTVRISKVTKWHAEGAVVGN
eukprot:Selendium_serpulae@DN6323_c0_g1_i2.p1